MRIVMKYTISDGYTFWSDKTVPIEYKSLEDAAVDFENLVKSHLLNIETRQYTFGFAGHKFNIDNFVCRIDKIYIEPEFLTIEEWFSRYSNVGKEH